MAAPNSVLTSIIINGTEARQATVSAATLVSNPAASNRVYKIDNLMATNRTEIPTDITFNLVRAISTVTLPTSTAGTFDMLRTSTLPGYTFINLIGKDLQMALQEGDRIDIFASRNSSIDVTVCYTVIG